MRILFVDIDTLRPDHLGCYGYHRNTSPNIDALARQATRFENCYVSDAPCLPSRTALWSGRTGFHTGAVNHGGTAADPFVEGASRSFRDQFGMFGWMRCLTQLGLHTASISPFGERHSAWHWYAGWREMHNPGFGGQELADDVTPLALDWIQRNAKGDNWFFHVNYWDPHTPYRTPASFGNPFENEPAPSWVNEDFRRRCWEGFGPHSAQEPHHYGPNDFHERYPRMPEQIDSIDAVKRWFDGYDCGIRYADEHIGRLLNALADQGVLDDTIVIVSSDHGENLGELNVWGDHQTADHATCRIPLIIRWPGITGEQRVDNSLHYHFDWAASLIEMLGGRVPDNWDGRSFAPAFRAGKDEGRPYLVVSQNAWSCQRAVRFGDHICMRTYHDGYKLLDPLMLFNLASDPHEQENIASSHPEIVGEAMTMLTEWEAEMMRTSRTNVDPMMTVLREGGPFHCRGELERYCQRLRATGREHHADRLSKLHG